MTISNSRQAYQDCYEVLDAAMDNPKGVRVACEDNNAAYFLRMRLHQARKIKRRDNLEVYEPGTAMHGCSIYDVLVVRLRFVDDSWWVYVEKQAIDTSRIQGLDTVEPSDEETDSATNEAAIRKAALPVTADRIRRI